VLFDIERERRQANRKRKAGQGVSLSGSRNWGDQYVFIRITAYMSAIGAVGFLLSNVPSHDASREYYCLNNALPRIQSDGPSVCVIQSAIVFYSTMSVYATLLAYCIFLFVRTVLMWKVPEVYYRYTAVLVVLIIPALSVVTSAAGGGFGFPGNMPWCIYHNKENREGSRIDSISTLYFIIIGAFFDVVSLLCMFAVIVKYVLWLSAASRKIRSVIGDSSDISTKKTTAKPAEGSNGVGGNSGSSTKAVVVVASNANERMSNMSSWLHTRASMSAIAKLLGPMALFHIALIMSAFGVLVFPITWFLFAKQFKVANNDWAECLFKQFYHRHAPPADEVWKSVCTETSSIINRHGYTTSYWVIFCISGQSLIIAVALLPGRIMKWFEKPKIREEDRRFKAWKSRMMSLILRSEQNKNK
jgi:hypothetical protein